MSEFKYLTTPELAKKLGVSRITIFNRIKKGKIPAEKIGRNYIIPYENVKGLIENKNSTILTEEKKEKIKKSVKKIIEEYGETLKLLGKE